MGGGIFGWSGDDVEFGWEADLSADQESQEDQAADEAGGEMSMVGLGVAPPFFENQKAGGEGEDMGHGAIDADLPDEEELEGEEPEGCAGGDDGESGEEFPGGGPFAGIVAGGPVGEDAHDEENRKREGGDGEWADSRPAAGEDGIAAGAGPAAGDSGFGGGFPQQKSGQDGRAGGEEGDGAKEGGIAFHDGNINSLLSRLLPL